MNAKFNPLFRVFILLVALLLAAIPFPAQAQTMGWEYIRIRPESGHWNYPGHFLLTAEQAVTVSWIIKCTFGGCDRPDEEGTHTFEAGETIAVGWGHQCYAWQLDPIGRTGFIADAEPELCQATPTPTATPVSPNESPTPTLTQPPASATPTPTMTLPPPDATAITPTEPGPSPTPPASITETPASPTVPPEPSPTTTRRPRRATPTPEVGLPTTGDGPPLPPVSYPLLAALAALLLMGMAGRTIWTGILQADLQTETIQAPAHRYPVVRAHATKALILILLSLLLLASLVLLPIVRQAAIDSGPPDLYNSQLPALAQEAPVHGASPNFQPAPAGQGSAVQAESLPAAQPGSRALSEPGAAFAPPLQPLAPDRSPGALAPDRSSGVLAGGGAGATAAQASVSENRGEPQADAGPVTRLVIPALDVDARVHGVPFENKTWDLKGLGMDVAWLGDTSSPGLGGNTVLAAHISLRDLGNGPFRYLHSLKPGDLVYVYTAGNLYTYSVREQTVVAPNDPTVVGITDRSQLTLLTCTGWDVETLTYTRRRAVFADLVDVMPSSSDTVDGRLQRE